MKKHIIIILISLLFISCNEKYKMKANLDQFAKNSEHEEGKSILNQNCITCHSPTANPNNLLAPSLIDIKRDYLRQTKGKEDYIKQMTSFLEKPDSINSKMPNAIEKFGLMPNLGYSKEQLRAVAIYLYSVDMNDENWLTIDYKKEKTTQNSENGTKNYLKKGLNIALSAKAVLGKNLLKAIKNKGPQGALFFCNERAIPLTDSMATHLQASIKRVSDKNRNPNNAANKKELEYIASAKQELKRNKNANPKVFEQNGKMIGYYPIITNDMCLKCHGNIETDIDTKTLTAIKKLYPNDKATGYSNNELRGIWVIEMNN